MSGSKKDSSKIILDSKEVKPLVSSFREDACFHDLVANSYTNDDSVNPNSEFPSTFSAYINGYSNHILFEKLSKSYLKVLPDKELKLNIFKSNTDDDASDEPVVKKSNITKAELNKLLELYSDLEDSDFSVATMISAIQKFCTTELKKVNDANDKIFITLATLMPSFIQNDKINAEQYIEFFKNNQTRIEVIISERKDKNNKDKDKPSKTKEKSSKSTNNQKDDME